MTALSKITEAEKIAFKIGNLSISWYAICIFLGMMTGIILAFIEAKKLGIDFEQLLDGIIIVLPLALIATRLYFVVLDNMKNPNKYNWDFLKIFGVTNDGLSFSGLAIHGGIAAAIILTFIYGKVRKMNLWSLFDLLAPSFLIAQVIGRWGNFFNQELYGQPMKGNNPLWFLPSFISSRMQIDGIYYQPLFLYEALWNLIAFILILILRRKRIFRSGDFIFIYLIWYGIGRTILEPLREEQFILEGFNNSMQSVIVSIMMVAFGIIGLIVKYTKERNLPYYCDITNKEKEKKDEEDDLEHDSII